MLGCYCQALRRAMRDRGGAVTMDWVVLSAAVIALVLSVGASMSAEISVITAALFGHASEQVEAMR